MQGSKACERKQNLALFGVLFGIYSMAGAIWEHLNTNLHNPVMSKVDPVRYPPRVKIQHNPVLTGFPFWGIAGVGVWQMDLLFKKLFFKNSKSRMTKLIFDFIVWSGLCTLGEFIYGSHFAGKKGYTKDGHLYSYDYSYMKYNYKGIIALPSSIAFGIMAVIFIRVNPYIIKFIEQGIDGTICPNLQKKHDIKL